MTANGAPLSLGLIGGLGVGAGIFYYRSLVNAHLALGVTPRILMAHADVRKVMDLAGKRSAPELAEYLAGLLGQLAAGGAEAAIVPAFSPQICARELEEIAPLPLIGLLDAIAEEIEARMLHRVSVLGAQVTMETGLFGRLEGLAELVPPGPQETIRVGEIYRRIVEKEQASEEEFDFLRELAHTLIARERLDAVILAGTDLAFVFNAENADFPHVDGARTHIRAIMRRCAERLAADA